jgi:hypothetical protein
MGEFIKGFYKGCVRSGNIGDDILFYGFLKLISNNIESKTNKKCNIVENQKISEILNFLETCDIGVIGGGSIMHTEETSYTGPIKYFNPRLKVLYGTGISDSHKVIMDKSYLKGVINFPYNEIMNNNISISNECIGGLRGPLDVEICKNIIKDYKPGWIYDSGILSGSLFKRDYSRLSNLLNIDNIVAVNICNASTDNIISEPGESNLEYHIRLMNEMIKVCDYLIDNGYYIIFYYMDGGDEGRVASIYNRLLDKSKACLIEGGLSFEEILSILEISKFTISNRLHAGILSLATKTPTVHLMYNFKCLNFAKSCDILEYSIPTNNELSFQKIVETVSLLEYNFDDYVLNIENHIKSATEKYKDLINNIIIDIDIEKSYYIEFYIKDDLTALFRIISN